MVVDETGVLWHTFEGWDSRQRTGFNGIKNQGATCYLNSLVQCLYFLSAFRKVFSKLIQAVHAIPTIGEDPNASVAYALQRLFDDMQNSSGDVRMFLFFI